MNLSERAKKIMSWDVPEGVSYSLPAMIDAKQAFIESELRAAVRKAMDDSLPAHCHRPDCALEARNDALEKAAQVAEKHTESCHGITCSHCAEIVAMDIRVLKEKP